MGARFEIGHANFVGYLTSDNRAKAPRADRDTLKMFLMSLAYGGTLISSTMGTADDWTRKIAYAAEREIDMVPREGDRVLTSDEVAQRLDPLRTYFTGYPLYAMVIPSGSWHSDQRSFRFFTESAVSSHANALILMPEETSELTSIIDPFPPLRMLAEHPTKPPLVVFWTPLKSSCVFPLDKAFEFFRQQLVSALDDDFSEVDRVVASAAARQRSRRILHLSDLHFGTSEAARRRRWLKEQLARELATIDRVVVTGDLFDNPEAALRESFDEFRGDVENITKKDLLVIPGNHDVRSKGNAFGRFGRNTEFITDLRWAPITIDHDLQTVFFAFNSSESGNFARGAVSDRQRLDRSTLFDAEARRDPRINDYLKISLVHHHPYAYNTSPQAAYEKVIANIFGGEEPFVAFDGGADFMNWCAARGVSLVLHGHKHVPHWVEAELSVRGQSQKVVVVGCGSTTGAGGRPMCFDVIAMDPATKCWSVLFYHDERGDGSGFGLQNVTVDLRSGSR